MYTGIQSPKTSDYTTPALSNTTIIQNPTTETVQHATQPSTISILSINVCGIKSKISRSEFMDLLNKYDIICMTETRCNDVDMWNVCEEMDALGFEMVYCIKIVLVYKNSSSPLVSLVP